MDRLSQLKGEAGGSRDSTLDASSLPSEAYMTANESSKYFSMSEEDSAFDISPIKDVSLASAVDPEKTITGTDQLISNLSPIPKKSDLLDSYKFDKIEAANILSGGVNIFDDNDNSYDGDELVIDDNVAEIEEKSNLELKLPETGHPFQKDVEVTETTLMDSELTVASKDTEVVLQIDGRNVNAIDIGNGLYLYRKEGEEELAAVQIIDDDQQQPSFKFLKVRENAEGNLEVYEEIEIEVPKEVPAKEVKTAQKNASHVNIRDINDVITDSAINKNAERKTKIPQKQLPIACTSEPPTETNKDSQIDTKAEGNMNGKPMKYNEKRKSPVIHSTPNKEGIPLTKTMVDLHLHPHRHSDKVKTIEVHTDSCKQKLLDIPTKTKDLSDVSKTSETLSDAGKVNLNNIQEHIDSKNSEGSNLEGDRIELFEVEKDTSQLNKVKCSSEEEILKHGKNHVQKDNTQLDKVKSLSEKDKSEVLDAKSSSKHTNETFSQEPEISIQDENMPSKTLVCNKDEKNKVQKKESLKETEVVQNNNQTNCDDNIKKKEKCHLGKIDTKSNLTSLDVDLTKDINIQSVCKTGENVENKVTANHSNAGEIKNEDQQSRAVSCSQVLKNTQSLVPGLNEDSSDTKEIKVGSTEKINEKSPVEMVQCQSTPLVDSKNSDITVSLADIPTKPGVIKNVAGDIVVDNTFEKKPSHANLPVTNVKPNQDTLSSNQKQKDIKNIAAAHSNKSETVKEVANLDVKQANDAINIVKLAKVDTQIAIQSQKEQPMKIELMLVSKSSLETQSKPKVDIKLTSKDNNTTVGIIKKNFINTDKPDVIIEKVPQKVEFRKEVQKCSANTEPKPTNNNHAAVPFGKWTEANRQEYLNKFKETKPHTNTSNTKQLKQPNDLNRRDVLQKIDSQRQSHNATAKVQEQSAAIKLNLKNEPVTFVNKPNANQEIKSPIKTEMLTLKDKPLLLSNALAKEEILQNEQTETSTLSITSPNINKQENTQRKEINTNQDLIDKTIEGIINRALPSKPNQDDTKQTITKDTTKDKKEASSNPIVFKAKEKKRQSLDAIEMKMNELHGIPFVERPPHELPQLLNPDLMINTKSEIPKENSNKTIKIPKLLPFSNKSQHKVIKENEVEVDSEEEEIIEHEPITGDSEPNKKIVTSKIPTKRSVTEAVKITNTDTQKKEPFITERDFDKFARRNSITYENCLTVTTVNVQGNATHNVVQSVVEKDVPVKKYSRNEILLNEAKVKGKASQKHQTLLHNKQTNKIQITSKLVPVSEDALNKNYQSKLQIAYQSALTTKRQMDSPITIIEDKPVKVVFMDTNTNSTQLNIQSKDLLPNKVLVESFDPDAITVSTCDSLDSDLLDVVDDGKSQDSPKTKTKHQRKQVLTSVETPDLELIEPGDLGIELSPKKKRRTDDTKTDKPSKNIIPKKSYLLGRSAALGEVSRSQKDQQKDTINPNNDFVSLKAASAIDSLVKAAELLETQSENINASVNSISSDNSQSIIPVKRGRGRPRKYPLPDGALDQTKSPSPLKKPRLVYAKKPKVVTDSDDDTSDEEMVRENWTMGKINENILCPICNKLFRSENVVFKHVKHCTGPSPNRSDSDKRSPRRSRYSYESQSRDSQSDVESETRDISSTEVIPQKRKSKDLISDISTDKDDIILVDEAYISEKPEKRIEPKQHESRKTTTKSKILHRTENLACEYCGKTFRQLSYLVSHKLQHKNEAIKKVENNDNKSTEKSIFSCEVCKKDFRKLHHLVQHRLLHNESIVASRPIRKSSAEQNDNKIVKEQDKSKPAEDQSAAFRCEPCDKSFRKLHHLVEHRETHDGINRQKNNSTVQSNEVKLPTQPPQCDICKKLFRKLHHLIEHKEQHLETSSEKSDDKSVKSSLSTKDIIHECSLCYMVFPNEHSLNKHSVFCQRKKRQSAVKQAKQKETETDEESKDAPKMEDSKLIIGDQKSTVEENIPPENIVQSDAIKTVIPVPEKFAELPKVSEISRSVDIVHNDVLKSQTKGAIEDVDDKSDVKVAKIPEIISKVNKNIEEKEVIKVREKPKKASIKDKVAPNVTKRQKCASNTLPIVNEGEVAAPESSDDDEVRYMLNPNFKGDETEGKLFMKVRAKKRNSLQIERPNSKDFVKRRTSLQNPPKIPRLKAKPIEVKIIPKNTTLKRLSRTIKSEAAPSTDSDDSDIKYSFPKTVDKTLNPEQKLKDVSKTTQEKRKSLVEKRKSLSGIAKRKSLGKAVLGKHKEKPTPVKQVKRRTTEVEHRCDCGQLFSSAALLSRHTSLAHTPPRIRRRRSPPPEVVTKATAISAPASRKSNVTDKKPIDLRKSSVKSDTSTTNAKTTTAARKSIVKREPKTPVTGRKSVKSSENTDTLKTSSTVVKSKRNIAHKGVPVPEKMRKLADKAKK